MYLWGLGDWGVGGLEGHVEEEGRLLGVGRDDLHCLLCQEIREEDSLSFIGGLLPVMEVVPQHLILWVVLRVRLLLVNCALPG